LTGSIHWGRKVRVVQLGGEGVIKGHFPAHIVFHVRDGIIKGKGQTLKVECRIAGFRIEKTGEFGWKPDSGQTLADFGQGQTVFVDQNVVNRFLFEIFP